MKISELLSEDAMKLDLKSKTKSEVIDELVDVLVQAGVINDRELYKKGILDRESLSSTGIGFGIAIPHAKSKAVNFPRVAFGVSKEGIDYESLDGTKANLFFMIAVNEGESDLHLKALANLSRLLMHEEFRNALLNAKTPSEVLNIVKNQEA